MFVCKHWFLLLFDTGMSADPLKLFINVTHSPAPPHMGPWGPMGPIGPVGPYVPMGGGGDGRRRRVAPKLNI